MNTCNTGGGEPYICVLSTAVITDVVRGLHHVDTVKSMQQQNRKPAVMYASVYADDTVKHMINLQETYKGKFMRDTNDALTVIHRKSRMHFVSHFRQLQYLVQKKCVALDGENTWCLFTEDDGIWHPDRVAMFEDAVRSVHMERDVSAVAIVNRLHISDRKRVDGSNVERCSQVDMLCDEGAIRIDGWVPQANAATPQPDTLELSDFAVRLDVVRNFFMDTPQDEILKNMYCTEHFCNYVATVPGKRTYYLKARHWQYFSRPADAQYTYCTGLQLASLTLPINNHIQLLKYVVKVAEMADIPCMKSTAATTLRGILDAIEDKGERAMVEYEYERARKDKRWTDK